jgi:hypothetical protein
MWNLILSFPCNFLFLKREWRLKHLEVRKELFYENETLERRLIGFFERTVGKAISKFSFGKSKSEPKL